MTEINVNVSYVYSVSISLESVRGDLHTYGYTAFYQGKSRWSSVSTESTDVHLVRFNAQVVCWYVDFVFRDIFVFSLFYYGYACPQT